MTDEMLELGRRAVACPAWRWMPGMLTLPFHEDDDRSKPECHPAWRVREAGRAGPWADDPTWGALPDLSDPATLGCLLALVREATGDPGAYASHRVGRGWFADVSGIRVHGATEAAALVAALEAA